jgi:hypothetical protein
MTRVSITLFSYVQSQYKSLLISERTTIDDLIELLLRFQSNNERIERFSIYYEVNIHFRTVPYRSVPFRSVPFRTVPYRSVPFRTVLIFLCVDIDLFLILIFLKFISNIFFCWCCCRFVIFLAIYEHERKLHPDDLALNVQTAWKTRFDCGNVANNSAGIAASILFFFRAEAQSRQQRPNGQTKGNSILFS